MKGNIKIGQLFFLHFKCKIVAKKETKLSPFVYSFYINDLEDE